MQKQFVEIQLEQCFRFDGQTFRKVETQYAPNDTQLQYNAVGVFSGDAWLFEDTDEVELMQTKAA